MRCPVCLEISTYITTREKNDQYYHFYYCYRCGKPMHEITYKYTPDTCPTVNGRKHQWEHIGTVFKDDPHCHRISHVDRCDRCGAKREIHRDTRNAGFTGRIEIDDPRVSRDLLWNRSVFDRFIPREFQELSIGNPDQHTILPTEAEV